MSCWCPLCFARTLETPLCLSVPHFLSISPHCRAAVFAAPGSNRFSLQRLWRCDTRRRWKTSERERNENEREPSSPSFPKVLCLLSLSLRLPLCPASLYEQKGSWSPKCSGGLPWMPLRAPFLPFLWSTVHLHFLPSFPPPSSLVLQLLFLLLLSGDSTWLPVLSEHPLLTPNQVEIKD